MRTFTRFLILACALIATSANAQTVIFEENFSYLTMAEAEGGASMKEDDFDLYCDNTGWEGLEVAKGGGTKDVEHPNYVNKFRVGYWSGEAHMTSPTIDLSKGTATLSVTLKAMARQKDGALMDYDKASILHAADGVNFTLVKIVEGININFQKFDIEITGGTKNSRIRIARVHATENAPNRFFIGSVILAEGGETGLEETQQGILNAYPNPVIDVLTIDTEADVVKASVYDLLGKTVVSSTASKTIDMTSLSKGIYWVEVILSDGEVAVKKVIKE